MNLQTKVVGIIAVSTALMLVLAPLLITSASAKISERVQTVVARVQMGLAMVIQTVMERRVPQRILQEKNQVDITPVRTVDTHL